MKAEYRRLGDYIRQVDVRNRDLAVNFLLGLSIEKKFIPSIANTIGPDLSSYKIDRSRDEVRRQAVSAALDLLLESL